MKVSKQSFTVLLGMKILGYHFSLPYILWLQRNAQMLLPFCIWLFKSALLFSDQHYLLRAYVILTFSSYFQSDILPCICTICTKVVYPQFWKWGEKVCQMECTCKTGSWRPSTRVCWEANYPCCDGCIILGGWPIIFSPSALLYWYI